MNARRLLYLVAVLVFCLAGVCCKSLSRKNYNLVKESPNGAYRVKVDVTVEDDHDWFGSFHEWGKIQFLKGTEIVDSRDWKIKETFEPTFMEANPVVEWTANNVLRMGASQQGKPFLDEVTVSNNTDENLKFVTVTCGKYEEFKVLDLPARGQITLRALPLDPCCTNDGPPRYSLVYGGSTQGGKEFESVVDLKQSKPREAGPIVFHVEISEKDLLSNKG